MQSLIVLVVTTLASLNALPSFDNEFFVVGGTEAKPHEFPWQVSLQNLNFLGKWSHTCGASILSPKYALTAAHCLNGRTNNSFRVVAGLHKLSNITGATVVNVKSFKIHERYRNETGTYSNDIAILTFASDIKFTDKIKPATLPANNKNKYVNESCVITGWGRNNGSISRADTLQKGVMGVVSNVDCQKRMPPADIIDSHICLFDQSLNISACNGDSGGPATCKLSSGKDAIVVGLMSFVMSSDGKCLPNHPSVYTRISEFLDWIKMNTR